MKIVLASPLYPPDIAPPAPYVKELARRLSLQHHVTIVAYGRYPERVPGVDIIAIDKRAALPLRLLRFTLALYRATRGADVLYAQNGPSVELPVALVTLLLRTPLYASLSDRAAHERARMSWMRGVLERFAMRHAIVVASALAKKPEILPFAPRPEAALAAYDASWESHIAALNKTLHHV